MRVTVTGKFIRHYGRMTATAPHQTQLMVNVLADGSATIAGLPHCKNNASGAHHVDALTDETAFNGAGASDCGVEENTVLC